MGTKCWKVEYDEQGIGGIGEYCGNNDAHLGRIKVFYHEALAASTCPARCSSTLGPA
jgi:hypothetical protein